MKAYGSSGWPKLIKSASISADRLTSPARPRPAPLGTELSDYADIRL